MYAEMICLGLLAWYIGLMLDWDIFVDGALGLRTVLPLLTVGCCILKAIQDSKGELPKEKEGKKKTGSRRTRGRVSHLDRQTVSYISIAVVPHDKDHKNEGAPMAPPHFMSAPPGTGGRCGLWCSPHRISRAK